MPAGARTGLTAPSYSPRITLAGPASGMEVASRYWLRKPRSRAQEAALRRRVAFDGCCDGALLETALAVCDYLAAVPRTKRTEDEPVQSHLETAIVAVVRRLLLQSMSRETPSGIRPTAELIASTTSWAIYGAALEWLRTEKRISSVHAAQMINDLVEPVLARSPWIHAHVAL